MYEQFLGGIVHSFVRYRQSWYQGNGLGQRRYGLPFRHYRLLPAALWEASTPPLQSERKAELFQPSSIRLTEQAVDYTLFSPDRCGAHARLRVTNVAQDVQCSFIGCLQFDYP